MGKRDALSHEEDEGLKEVAHQLPPSYFRFYKNLSLRRQTLLLKHFVSEFDMAYREAAKDLAKCSEVEIALHLDAAINGYM